MLLTRKRKLMLLAIAGILAAFAYTWIFHDVFTSREPGANDFFSRWAGARLYFTNGWNPYGPETSRWIQEAIYGHAAEPGQDPSLFAYPFYTIFLVGPFALIGDYSWAQAAWQVTLQIALLATLALILKYHKWRPSPLMLGLVVLWTILFYPTARSIILGQIGVIVLALSILSAWLIFRYEPSAASHMKADPKSGSDVRQALSRLAAARWDLTLGFFLSITTVKPQMQFLIIPFFLITTLLNKRPLVLVSFLLSLGALLGLSFVMQPSWYSDWLAQLFNYPDYTPPAVLYILTHEVLFLDSLASGIERALDVILLAYLVIEWIVYWRLPEDARATWLIGLTFVVTHLIAPRTATTHFIVFLFSLILLFRDLSRQGWVGTTLMVTLMLLLGVGMWWLFISTLVGNQESDLVHLPLPLLMLIVMLLTRPSHYPQKATSA